MGFFYFELVLFFWDCYTTGSCSIRKVAKNGEKFNNAEVYTSYVKLLKCQLSIVINLAITPNAYLLIELSIL